MTRRATRLRRRSRAKRHIRIAGDNATIAIAGYSRRDTMRLLDAVAAFTTATNTTPPRNETP